MVKLFIDEYGDAKKVIATNGAATKNGKLSGNSLNVKKGIIKTKLPIIICRNFLEMLLFILPLK